MTLDKSHEGPILSDPEEQGECLPPAYPVGVWGGLMRWCLSSASGSLETVTVCQELGVWARTASCPFLTSLSYLDFIRSAMKVLAQRRVGWGGHNPGWVWPGRSSYSHSLNPHLSTRGHLGSLAPCPTFDARDEWLKTSSGLFVYNWDLLFPVTILHPHPHP